MAINHMNFTFSNFELSVSELYDDNTITVRMWGNGNNCSVKLAPDNINELKKWLMRWDAEAKRRKKAKPKP